MCWDCQWDSKVRYEFPPILHTQGRTLEAIYTVREKHRVKYSFRVDFTLSVHTKIAAFVWFFLQDRMYETREPMDGDRNLFIGRANTDMRREKYANAVYDDFEIWYGDRQSLIDKGYIQRGRLYYGYILSSVCLRLCLFS